MAPNTAMLSSTLPMVAPPCSAPSANQMASMTASPASAPAIIATCGVLKVGWVTESAVGK